MVMSVILLCSITFVSCRKENANNPGNKSEGMTSYQQKSGDEKRPKIHFKHTGMGTPSNPNPPSCEEPGGLCITSRMPTVDHDYQFSEDEKKDGFGSAILSMPSSTQLKLIPDTKFAYKNWTIEIQDTLTIDNVLSAQLGYHTIQMQKGIYSVDSTEGNYGSVKITVMSN